MSGRISLKVNKADLYQAIRELESENEYPNLSALWKAVACSPRGEAGGWTPSVVMLRVKEFGIEVETKAGRKSLSPEETREAKAALQKQIDKLENEQQFETRGELFEAVAASPWGKSQRLTPAAVGSQAHKFDVTIKTRGQRGRKAGVPMSDEQKAAMQAGRKHRTPRSEKMKAFSKSFELMRERVGSSRAGLVDQGENGSIRALVALKCLDCACYQVVEIKYCPVVSCSLYPIRPYQPKDASDTKDHPAETSDEAEEILVGGQVPPAKVGGL